MQIEENGKIDKYFDCARELKKMCYMKEMVIPVIVGAIGIYSYLSKT